MKEFFLLLFFAKSVLLTPEPVSFVGSIQITPNESISAITPNAGIIIDVSNSTQHVGIKESGFMKSQELLNYAHPKDSINASIYDTQGNKYALKKISYHLNNHGAMISIYPEEKLPVGTEFSKITINSKVELKNVLIYWRNYTM